MIDPRHPDYANTPASEQRTTFGYAPVDPHVPPVVSIITPFFNTASIFHETARCIFRQSLQQWEWIIVNDRSTDSVALAMLDAYRERDPRIRVIDNRENLGLPGTRNAGFEAARAELVFLLDDDDLIEPTALEKMAWFLHSHPEFAAVNGWSIGFGAKNYLWPTGFNRGREMLEANYATGRAMVRRSVHRAVGGYDAELRHGMEDWEFWLRLAAHGYWGATIPEFLDWYRRREDHGDRWAALDGGERQRALTTMLRERYTHLRDGDFPEVSARVGEALDPIRTEPPLANPLTKDGRRVLLVMPWMALGGADKFNLDLLEQIQQRGWQMTIAATLGRDNPWAARFARFTPDIFALPNFLRPTDYPAFLRYLIESRRPDVVLLSNSELAYWLLPFLRKFCPGPAYVDYCHSETPQWKDGGFPRYGAANQDLLDLNLVASAHLREWMTERGADPGRIEVVTVNVDAEAWAPQPGVRESVRRELDIPDSLPVILFAGRLHPDKQPAVLAGTLRELRARGCPFRALLAGDGPERPFLEQFIAEHELGEQVSLLGEVSIDRMRKLYWASDVFFLPSRWEGIALTLYEAMAAGLPVLAADVGGQAELVTPDCGVLLPRGDESSEIARYSDALAALLGDAPRRRALGERARQRVRSGFTLEQMGERISACLERAIRERRRAADLPVQGRFAVECATHAIEHLRLATALDQLWVSWQESDKDERSPAGWLERVAQERDEAWAEAQRLARGWEAQHEYIQRLEAEHRKVVVALERSRRFSPLRPLRAAARRWPLAPLLARLRNGSSARG